MAWKDEVGVMGMQAVALQAAAARVAVGQQVRVVSDYNGQPHSRSRPSLKGLVTTIKDVYVWPTGVWLVLADRRCKDSIRLEEVEAVDGAPGA